MPRAAAIAGILALAAAGCIVTDKIDFRDDVNAPPQVIGVFPDNGDVQTECQEAEPEFKVSLWDPDEEDAPPRTEAQIHVWLNAGGADEAQAAVAGDCTVTATSPTADSPYQGGVLLTAECKMTILAGPISVADGDILPTRVLVSDRPFVHGEPPEDARTAEVFWTLEVLSEDECPGE